MTERDKHEEGCQSTGGDVADCTCKRQHDT